MKKIVTFIFLLLLGLITLSACSDDRQIVSDAATKSVETIEAITLSATAQPTAAPQALNTHIETPTPKSTSKPTHTPTSSPTATKVPTPTPFLFSQPVAAISAENAPQLTQVGLFGRGYTTDIAFSPDGKLLAVANSLGIDLYDSESLDLVHQIETKYYSSGIVFSPDGNAIASNRGLWQVKDGSSVFSWELPPDKYYGSIVTSPDGSTLAIGSDGVWRNDSRSRECNTDDLLIVDLQTGHQLPAIDDFIGCVISLAYSPNGEILAIATRNRNVELRRTSDGKLIHILEFFGDYGDILFSPDGSILAVHTQRDAVDLWQTSDWSLLRHQTGGASRGPMAFSSDGNTLAFGTSLWQTSDGESIKTFSQPAGRFIWDVEFMPNHDVLAIQFGTGEIELFETPQLSSIGGINDYTYRSQDVAFSPDGKFVVSSSDYRARVWNVLDGSLEFDVTSYSCQMRKVAFSPDSQTIAVAACSSKPPSNTTSNTFAGTAISYWSISGEMKERIKRDAPMPWYAAFLPNLDVVVLASSNNISLWEPLESELLSELGNSASSVSLDVSKDGSILGAGGQDGTIKLWRLRDKWLMRTLKAHEDPVLRISISPDDNLVASSSSDGTVRLWKTSNGELLHTFSVTDNCITVDNCRSAIAFSPDSSILATGLDDGLIKLWTTNDGTSLYEWRGHIRESIGGLAFSSDGHYLASAGGFSGIVRLWGIPEIEQYSTGNIP